MSAPLNRCDSCHGEAEKLLDAAKEMEDSISVNLRFRLHLLNLWISCIPVYMNLFILRVAPKICMDDTNNELVLFKWFRIAALKKTDDRDMGF